MLNCIQRSEGYIITGRIPSGVDAVRNLGANNVITDVSDKSDWQFELIVRFRVRTFDFKVDY